jgi:bifunctional non-homologous end joining protein LigD
MPIAFGPRGSPYDAKRDLAASGEPPFFPANPAGHAPIFVVQEHAADRAGLHYDFRLEAAGVLWSWAVPKGPSMDPSQKRMAIRVEDHPVDYAAFQGTIPKGNYGAGTVKTWDSGTWVPLGVAPEEGIRRGELKFELHGSKLRGRFALVRWARQSTAGRRETWLLVKERDEHAAPRAVAEAVEITNPTRQVWDGFDKADLADYWLAVAPLALPGIARRPLAVVRAPKGVGASAKDFFQRSGRGALPSEIRDGSAGGTSYLAIDDAMGLAAMAQISAVEIHAWGCTEADPLRPDQLVFDLDPGPSVGMERLAQAAHMVKERLARIGMASFCRTSGDRGLHVVVPLRPRAGWGEAMAFSRNFAEAAARDFPAILTANPKIAGRGDLVLVDWMRNSSGSTAVASYSPRALHGAPVATPLAWGEVSASLQPALLTVRTVPSRKDPWGRFEAGRYPLPRA